MPRECNKTRPAVIGIVTKTYYYSNNRDNYCQQFTQTKVALVALLLRSLLVYPTDI